MWPKWAKYAAMSIRSLDNPTHNDCFHDRRLSFGPLDSHSLVQVRQPIYHYIYSDIKQNTSWFQFFSSNTFVRISRQSAQFWKCQRYHFVTAYESKPLLAPPLIVFSHLFMLIKYAIRLCLRKKIKFDRKLSKSKNEYYDNQAYL